MTVRRYISSIVMEPEGTPAYLAGCRFRVMLDDGSELGGAMRAEMLPPTMMDFARLHLAIHADGIEVKTASGKPGEPEVLLE